MLSSRSNELPTFPWMHPVIVHVTFQDKIHLEHVMFFFVTPSAQSWFKTGALRNKQRIKPHNTTQTEQTKPKTGKEGKTGQWWWLADFSPWITGVIAWTVSNTIRAFRVECKLNIHPLTSEFMCKMLPLTQTPHKIKVSLWVLVVSFIEPLGSELCLANLSLIKKKDYSFTALLLELHNLAKHLLL